MENKHINEIFRQNFTKYLNNSKKTQKELADYLGVSTSMISMYKTGTNVPRMGRIDKIARFFNIDRMDLIGRTTKPEQEPQKPKGIKIPVLGEVAAGVPISAIEDILDYEEISPEMARTGEFFALQIKGRSMEPRILAGDIVIVKQQSDVDSGDIAIVLVNGDSATCKKIQKKDNGIMLIPLNSDYPTDFYTIDEILEKPVTIIGKVVELRGKF